MQIDGVSLHYEQQGLGQPVVFVHGLMTHSYLWRTIILGLTYGNAVYTVDLMGFGFSEKPQNVTYRLDMYVEQLSLLLEKLKLSKPILVGHDLGAAIVALYTIRHPEKVNKLVLMGAPFFSDSSPLSIRLLRLPVMGEFLSRDWFLARFLRSGVENPTALNETALKAYLSPYDDDPGARAALLKCLRELDLPFFLAQEIQPNLTHLRIPTLLVWGGNDEYIPVAFGRKLQADLPHAQIEVILHSGHYVQEDRPEEVRAVLKAFIED